MLLFSESKATAYFVSLFLVTAAGFKLSICKQNIVAAKHIQKHMAESNQSNQSSIRSVDSSLYLVVHRENLEVFLL